MAGDKQRFTLKSILKSIGFNFTLVLITIITVVLIRIFAFAVFTIPSNSMVPSILPGDKIMVNKLLFGGRVYNIFESSTEKQATRIKGFRKINYNDILVFNFPHKNSWDTIEMDLNQYYVKRCIGLPGDTLEIKNGFFNTSDRPATLGIISSQEKLSKTSDENLKQIEGIYNTFPYDAIHNWNIKNFGPLHIPKKGQAIVLNSQNIILYKRLIQDETKGLIAIKNDTIYLNSQRLDRYVFTSNYYFVAGDNGLNSQDSRYWGFLPEYCIVGIATHVWSSVDPYTREYRTDRFLKKLDQ